MVKLPIWKGYYIFPNLFLSDPLGAERGGGVALRLAFVVHQWALLDYALRMNSASTPTLITIGVNCSSGVLSIRTGRPYIS